ncbi:hypothetical protein PCASD_17562 [Puccinia coronata f. sp. avenae]|uniref:Uncharacterized protein n=1 Tax=Puccinia coronata f. sp. avenae TaxID=200324 RepID=A0A2N5U5X6_9BASI|nr:hypothetical protein PCASD_17562 [Puccinia coronata f. sp. avenae]
MIPRTGGGQARRLASRRVEVAESGGLVGSLAGGQPPHSVKDGLTRCLGWSNFITKSMASSQASIGCEMAGSLPDERYLIQSQTEQVANGSA